MTINNHFNLTAGTFTCLCEHAEEDQNFNISLINSINNDTMYHILDGGCTEVLELR